MAHGERPLDLDYQLKLYRSITKALTTIVLAREAWIAHVEEHGSCYCENPFRAHVDRAEEWTRFHLANCAANQYWIDAAADRLKAAAPSSTAAAKESK